MDNDFATGKANKHSREDVGIDPSAGDDDHDLSLYWATPGASEATEDDLSYRNLRPEVLLSSGLSKIQSSQDEVVIGLWPYGNTTPEGDDWAKAQKSHVERIVSVFLVVFLFVFLFEVLRGQFFNILIHTNGLLALAVIPLLSSFRGVTHLKIDKYGLELLSINVAHKKVRKSIYWKNVGRVYLDGKTKPTPLDQSLCFEEASGRVTRIKLRKIANRNQWNTLMEALDKWCRIDLSDLNRDVFNSFSQDRTSPTYTMLWLEALAAPPKRERLNPLEAGALLSQGRYRLLRRLGAGGQGSAYLAESIADCSRVVLKEYILPIYVDMKTRKQALENFENEARMLTTLNHPAIVKLLDYFVDDHRAYLVLEFIDGDNLQRFVENNGPLTNSVACQFAFCLVDILSYLHGQAPPVVHRDFTPDNLIVSKAGEIKLIDFMVAERAQIAQPSTTTVGTVVGKHAYMAPEQFRCQNRTESDIYAFGGTLFYMLTGEEPEPITQLHPILKNDRCHPIFDDIVAKCTEADFAERYHHVDEIRRQLNQIAAES